MTDPLRENTRIDKGVKRPRYPQPKPRPLAEGQSPEIPVTLDADEVLKEYLTEGKTSGIAARYGIRRSALTRWLRHTKPEQWKEIQVIRALCTKEDGEQGLYDAETALNLARARELIRSAQWDLERLDSATFGQQIQQVIDINHHVLVEHGLADSALTLFESMRGITHTDQTVTLDQPKSDQD